MPQTKTKSFLGRDGQLAATVTLDSGSVLLGETIHLAIAVTNSTKVGLAKIRIKLRTHTTVTAETHQESDWTSTVVLGVLSPAVGPEAARAVVAGPHTDVERTCAVKIPVSAESTHKSSLVATTHSIEVELVPEGWLHRSMRVSLPVFVLAPGGGLDPGATGRMSARRAGIGTAVSTTAAEEPTGDDDVRAALAEVGSWGKLGTASPGTVSAVTAKGHTALHLACLRQQPGLAQALIAAGCDPAARTHAGFTALHSAAFGGDTSTCIAVLDSCAPFSLQPLLTSKGSTAAGLAKKDVPGHSPPDPALAELICSWVPAVAAATETKAEAGDEALHPRGFGGDSGSATCSDTAPKIVEWTPDGDATACRACHTAFTFFTRRHHCRGCGTLICAACGPKRALPENDAAPERTCLACWTALPKP